MACNASAGEWSGGAKGSVARSVVTRRRGRLGIEDSSVTAPGCQRPFASANPAFQKSARPADDPFVAKYLVLVVVLLMAGAALASTLRVEQVQANPLVAFVFPPNQAAPPDYVDSIGNTAPVDTPDANYETWFAAGNAEDAGAERDPLDIATWQEVAAVAAVANTETGWAEVCDAAGDALALDRVDEPLLGALGCSDDPSVTRVQQFAVQILDTQAHLALWIRGAPGFSLASVQARQGEVRLQCAVDVVAREGGEGSPYAEACALALDTAYLSGGGLTTFEALAAAYALVAGEIAARDPAVDAEPAFFTIES